MRELTNSPILFAAAGELNQRNHREGQLKAQNHLAEDQQRGYFGFARDANDQRGRQMAMERVIRRRNQGFRRMSQKTFHDNLAGERAGERGVLSRSQQRAGKHGAGETGAQQRAQQFVGVCNFRDVMEAASVKHRRA